MDQEVQGPLSYIKGLKEIGSSEGTASKKERQTGELDSWKHDKESFSKR